MRPRNKVARLLAHQGINANDVSVDGFTRYGYQLLHRDRRGRWQLTPQGRIRFDTTTWHGVNRACRDRILAEARRLSRMRGFAIHSRL